MARRTRHRDQKRLGLERDTSSNLNRLMWAVAYQTVIRQAETLTVEELIECLLPAEDIETLRRAKPLVPEYYASIVRPQLMWNSAPVTFYINLRELDMTLWRGDVACFQPSATKAGVLTNLVDGLFEVHQRFKKVETLIQWLDLHASWGAVRYYWPSACALLSNDHEIHRIDGVSFREPKAPMGPMIPLCRETSIIIAEAMLCPLDVPAATTAEIVFGNTKFGLITDG